jgi:hypothetical protein
LGEVEDASAVAAFGHFEQSSAASLFHIVTVRSQGKNVERRHFVIL